MNLKDIMLTEKYYTVIPLISSSHSDQIHRDRSRILVAVGSVENRKLFLSDDSISL